MLKNYMEIVVDDILSDILRKKDLKCECKMCINDIKAITLNNLKPMYVSTDKGILYSKLNESSLQSKADVINELTIAIEKVGKSPRH